MAPGPPSDFRTALVTGSGRRRLGWHVARSLVERGYAVALHYHTSAAQARQTEEELQGSGAAVMALQADLTDAGQVAALVEQVLRRWGRLDVLVHCAAIWRSKRLEEVTAQDVREHLEANTLATFLICREAGLAMVGQPQGGTIVTFGDWATARPYLHYAAYFPSKGAIEALTRSLAVELGVRNPRVRVNCVLPGPVMLPDDLPADERQRVIRATLLKREGSPQHVVQAVWHFIENDFVTGTCLAVDGGRTIYSADVVDTAGESP
jgi:pteridine reductase